jgi:4-hydroxy-tetrahydrodipicolinate synthase
MNNQFSFSGTGVALVTPFKNQEIDFLALGNIIEHVIQGGVNYLVTLGTTGEASSLESEEQEKVIRFTIEKADGRVPVVVGSFGHNNTKQLVEKIKKFNFEGVAAILSSSPAYNKPTQEGIFQHYMAIAEVSPVPIIIYNVPNRTSSNITADTILRLANEGKGKFAGVKEAAGDLVQAIRIAKDKPEDFLLLSGDDMITLPMIASGGEGVISVIANVLPGIFSDMVRATRACDLSTANYLNNLCFDLHPWLYIEGNPSGIKSALSHLGLCTPEVRLPLVPLSERNAEKMAKEIDLILASVNS